MVGVGVSVITLVLEAIFFLGLFTSEFGLVMAFSAAVVAGFVAGSIVGLCVGLRTG
jgi:hypothetical protein